MSSPAVVPLNMLGPYHLDFILKNHLFCRRKEPMIAIGGGVCLDVAGLTANLYRRNTPVIKVNIFTIYFSCFSWPIVKAMRLLYMWTSWASLSTIKIAFWMGCILLDIHHRWQMTACLWLCIASNLARPNSLMHLLTKTFGRGSIPYVGSSSSCIKMKVCCCRSPQLSWLPLMHLLESRLLSILRTRRTNLGPIVHL